MMPEWGAYLGGAKAREQVCDSRRLYVSLTVYPFRGYRRASGRVKVAAVSLDVPAERKEVMEDMVALVGKAEVVPEEL